MKSLSPAGLMRFARRQIQSFEKRNIDRFLSRSRGVIHIGASTGQEADTYASHGLPVLWVEPIPESFAKLQERVKQFPKQRAVQHLVTDRDGAEYEFNIASNDGMSSSIFAFGEHSSIWPEVRYQRTITLRSITLRTLMADLADEYDTLVLDVQGAEALVLRGAGELLNRFRYLKMESYDVPLYHGGSTREETDAILLPLGFKAIARRRLPDSPVMDVVYARHQNVG